MSYRSKLTVSCDARPVAGSTEAPPGELLEWCVKACEAHGYIQENGFQLAEVSEYRLPPRLVGSLWPWARKITPIQCLPYKPMVKKSKLESSEGCLEYGRRVTVAGMLVSYDGWELSLKDPLPGCALSDANDPRRRPMAGSLNDITLIVSKADMDRFERRIGEQLTVIGRLEYRVYKDTASFNLVDVELPGHKVESSF